MKFFWLALAALFSVSAWAVPNGLGARAWVVIDQASGRELAGHQADLPMPPASLTQLMTAYVILDDVRRKRLRLDQTIDVPAAAASVDGARVFLAPGEALRVDTLLQAMLVHSASDATLTLATATDASEAAFVERMNQHAARLGMTKTRFTNATGLHQPGHESSARDLAVLGRVLMRDFPDHQALFAQRELRVKGVTYYNSNRLLWRDSTVNGLKVGRTVEAGYCMAASAQRGDQRRVAVVLGARSDAQRTQDTLRLLNYGFESFDSVLLYRAQHPVKAVSLYRGARSSVSMGFLQDFHLLLPKGAASRVKGEVITQQPIVAPVRKGQRIGTLRLSLDGKPIGDYPLVALHNVSVAGIFGRGWDTLRLFFGL
jgi:D-alanyl-D-alanine carboxypeptidase/D-alanyl-D-alanine carboxypeptidase (penicillin-binding protein 5/6)